MRQTADMTENQVRPARSPYHALLPVGERVSADPLRDDPFFGFDGDLTVRPLDPMLVPEEPRSGELDPSGCYHCGPGTDQAIWRDDHWHLGAVDRTGLPFLGGLAPNAHLRLDQLGPDLLTTFGGVVQRVSEAVKRIDGVARTHFSRWGDGSAHFHLHFLARPAGMMQGRGPMLAFWDDLLPPVPDALRVAHARVVAAAMADGGGEALLADEPRST